MFSRRFPTANLRFKRLVQALAPLALGLGLATGVAAGLALPGTAHAGGTKSLRLKSFSDFRAGQLEGALLTPEAKVVVGYNHEGSSFSDARVAFRCVEGKSGVLVGTANKSGVWALTPGREGPGLRKIAALEGAAVSALYQHRDGRIYAATLPGATIYEISRSGRVSTLLKLEAQRIWDLRWHQNALYAATGPDGKVFRIDLKKKQAKVVLDTESVDVLTLLSTSRALLAGTGGKARLYKITSKKEGILLREFAGEELRALRYAQNTVYALVNRFDSPGISGLAKMSKNVLRSSLIGEKPSRSDLDRPEPKAEGLVYQIRFDGNTDTLSQGAWDKALHRKSEYFTDLLPLYKGRQALVASAQEGKVYRISSDLNTALIADFPERQTTALCARKNQSKLYYALTSDGATAYRLISGQAKKAIYTSKVLETEQPARFGSIRAHLNGRVEIQIRTGPSEDVDLRWGDWKNVAMSADGIYRSGRIRAPKGRFLQIRALLLSAQASVADIELFYQPENIAPRLGPISVKGPRFDPDDDDEPEATATVKWEVDERDDDDTQYQVEIRPYQTRAASWETLHDGEPIRKEQYKLDLATLPDGYYQVAVTASDEPSNGIASALSHRRVSDPFVVDRQRPVFEEVKQKGLRISGTVRDRYSRIVEVSFRGEDQKFRPASPRDGLFDQKREGFEIILPRQKKGPYRIVLRVRDEYGNRGLKAIVVQPAS